MVPENVISAISAYHTEWRHPRWVPLQTSGIYALFPDEATSVRFDARWPDAWPLGDCVPRGESLLEKSTDFCCDNRRSPRLFGPATRTAGA